MATSHTIRISTNDGQILAFACAEDESLLDGAAKSGVALPAICREGNCGACVGTCSSGDFVMPYYNPIALHPDRVAEGQILMCQAFPRGEMAVAVDADAARLTGGPVPQRAARVTGNDDMGGGVRRLRLEISPDANGDIGPGFEPGQYMELEIPGGGLRRAYSLANAPNWEGKLEFLIRLRSDGAFSRWLTETAAIGDTVKTIGPKGSFVLQAGGINPRRFVAGGTGVAPMMSMLRQMAEFGETNPARLYFGVNSPADLFALDDLAALQAALPNLAVDVCIWMSDATWENTSDAPWVRFAGSPVDALARDLAADLAGGVKPEVYLCGPPGMVDGAQNAAIAAGLPKDRVFAERFLPT